MYPLTTAGIGPLHLQSQIMEASQPLMLNIRVHLKIMSMQW